MIKMSLLFNNDIENKVHIKEKIEDKKEVSQKEEKKSIEKKEDNDELKKIKINNALYGANKDLKKEFNNNFSKINEYVSSKEYNSISNLLLKSVPEVVSDKNIIFTFNDNFEVLLFNKNEEEIQKFLKLIYKKKYSIVAITKEEWKIVREEYINKTKSGIKYEYIEENKKTTKGKKTTELENTVENLFGEDLIKID